MQYPTRSECFGDDMLSTVLMVSDAVIFVAYIVLPIVFVHAARKFNVIRHFGQADWLLVVGLCVFILAGATSHGLGFALWWYRVYPAYVVSHAITAIVSILYTILLLAYAVPGAYRNVRGFVEYRDKQAQLQVERLRRQVEELLTKKGNQ